MHCGRMSNPHGEPNGPTLIIPRSLRFPTRLTGAPIARVAASTPVAFGPRRPARWRRPLSCKRGRLRPKCCRWLAAGATALRGLKAVCGRSQLLAGISRLALRLRAVIGAGWPHSLKRLLPSDRASGCSRPELPIANAGLRVLARRVEHPPAREGRSGVSKGLAQSAAK